MSDSVSFSSSLAESIGPDFEFNSDLLWGSLLCFLGGALCSGGGIGGGAFYLAAFMLVLGLDAHYAIPLSKTTIFGVAIGGLIVLLPQKHPKDPNRRLVDFNSIALLVPNVLLGSVLGVMLNVVCPTWLIVVCLCALLAFTSYRTIKKGLTLHKKEKSAKNFEKAEEKKENVEMVETNESEITLQLAEEDDMVIQEEFVGLKSSNMVWNPKDRCGNVSKAAIMIISLLGMLAIVVLKGGSSGVSAVGIECGSLGYWLVTASVVPFFGLMSFIAIMREKKHPRPVMLEGDPVMNTKNILYIVLGGILGGVIASFLGVGGGMVIGPLLLELGLLPQVGTATSSFMILFTASSSSFQYVILGRVELSYALWYFGVGVCSAIVGQLFVAWLVKKTNKQSIVTFFLAIVIVVSACAMLFLLCLTMYNDIKNGESMGFHDLCG